MSLALTCLGDFQVTVSKTVAGNMDEALEKWVKSLDGMTEFDGVKITSEPRPMASKKLVKLPHSKNRLAAR